MGRDSTGRCVSSWAIWDRERSTSGIWWPKAWTGCAARCTDDGDLARRIAVQIRLARSYDSPDNELEPIPGSCSAGGLMTRLERRRSGMRDVAERAGVAMSSVSRVLSDHPDV